MFDLGFSKLVVIGVVALIVIGPERLPKVAKTLGTLLGKAQRYVNDVKREVNQAMELDELRKMRSSIEGAARDLQQTVRSHASDVQGEFGKLSDEFDKDLKPPAAVHSTRREDHQKPLEDASKREFVTAVVPVHHTPSRKQWRVKRQAVPSWYKARHQVRRRVQSNAARLAQHRPND